MKFKRNAPESYSSRCGKYHIEKHNEQWHVYKDGKGKIGKTRTFKAAKLVPKAHETGLIVDSISVICAD